MSSSKNINKINKIKQCSKCKEDKPVNKFSPGSSWCKSCRNIKMKERKVYLQTNDIPYINPKLAKVNEEDKYLDSDMWEKITQTCKNMDLLFYLDLTQSLGLRASETFSLRVEDIDFNAGMIRVTSLKRKDGAKLSLYIRPDLITEIRRRGLTFSFGYHRAWVMWKTLLSTCNINTRLGLHSLRHLAATRLQECGANVFEIGRILRHTPTGVTAIYVHITPNRLKELAIMTWGKQPKLWENVKNPENP